MKNGVNSFSHSSQLNEQGLDLICLAYDLSWYNYVSLPRTLRAEHTLEPRDPTPRFQLPSGNSLIYLLTFSVKLSRLGLDRPVGGFVGQSNLRRGRCEATQLIYKPS